MKPKPLPGRWVCNKCTAQNWNHHLDCTACCKGTKAESEMKPKRETAEQRHDAEAHRNGFGRLADCGVDKEAGFCGCTQYEEPQK